MKILRNARHERLAAALADGLSQEAAYVQAGYSPKGARAAASRLLQQNISILQRRDELLRERERAAQQIQSEVIKMVVADKAWLLERAIALVERGMQSYPVTDRKGDPVVIVTEAGEVRPMYGFNDRAVAAGLRIIGLAQGHFVVRHRNDEDVFSGLPPEVVREIRARLQRLLSEGRISSPSLQVINSN